MSHAKPDDILAIKVEFIGGLESLFRNQRSHLVQLPRSSASQAPTIADLISHLAATFLAHNARRNLFVQDDECRSVRPGILVLINDADWELEDGADCKLKSGDEVCFVSTLHGG